jgi:hypothetical protein
MHLASLDNLRLELAGTVRARAGAAPHPRRCHTTIVDSRYRVLTSMSLSYPPGIAPSAPAAELCSTFGVAAQIYLH